MKRSESQDNQLVFVASVHEEAAHRIAGLLKNEGIPALIYCDLRVCGVRVPRRDRKRALEILEKDAKAHRYWIRFDRGS